MEEEIYFPETRSRQKLLVKIFFCVLWGFGAGLVLELFVFLEKFSWTGGLFWARAWPFPVLVALAAIVYHFHSFIWEWKIRNQNLGREVLISPQALRLSSPMSQIFEVPNLLDVHWRRRFSRSTPPYFIVPWDQIESFQGVYIRKWMISSTMYKIKMKNQDASLFVGMFPPIVEKQVFKILFEKTKLVANPPSLIRM